MTGHEGGTPPTTWGQLLHLGSWLEEQTGGDTIGMYCWKFAAITVKLLHWTTKMSLRGLLCTHMRSNPRRDILVVVQCNNFNKSDNIGRIKWDGCWKWAWSSKQFFFWPWEGWKDSCRLWKKGPWCGTCLTRNISCRNCTVIAANFQQYIPTVSPPVCSSSQEPQWSSCTQFGGGVPPSCPVISVRFYSRRLPQSNITSPSIWELDLDLSVYRNIKQYHQETVNFHGSGNVHITPRNWREMNTSYPKPP